MPYRIDPESAPASELRRVAREQTTKAVADLAELELREAVHEARKRLKKIRAVLRLFRPRLGDLYKQENIRFRNLARDLAPIRDATTLLEALDALEKASGERFEAVRSGLNERREQVERDAGSDDLIARTQHALETALSEIPGWRLRKAANSFPSGWTLTYKRGRAALKKARKSADAELLHEWRKRAKYHRYHCRLLERVWKKPLKAREQEAHDLGNLLGEHHDLSQLEAAVGADRNFFGGREAVESLLSQGARRRAKLESDAFRLGAKLYAEKPKKALRRMECYWRIARR